VNEAFARAYFPNENPVGKRGPQAPTQIEIVGVVADAKAYSLRETAPPMVYRPLTQTGSAIRTAIIRTSGKPEDRMADIRSVVHDVDANLPIRDFSTQMGLIDGSLTPERMLATASVLFGGFALVIAMIGLFGLMSYGVARRTSEIGIRMALGATKNEILNSVLREALRVVGVGVVLGLAAALALNRFISSLLFGLAPNDLLTITAATCSTILAALLAAYLPARRASRVDPMVALRHE
jgi:predicted lysophospholipase L1 biosynthesis ABC-type transport system permease subunit